MDTEKIIALLEEVAKGGTVDTIVITDDERIEVDTETYLVLTDNEADRRFREYQEELINDLGLGSFSMWAKNHIIENFVDADWFDEAKEEYFRSYVEDIKLEGFRLEHEMREADCEDEEEFIEYLCDSDEDSITWYRNNVGENCFNETIAEQDLIMWDDVIEWVKEIDGRQCLAIYDGSELELDNGYYAYRID